MLHSPHTVNPDTLPPTLLITTPPYEFLGDTTQINNGIWRPVGGQVDVRRNVVTAQVRHFSVFALFPAAGALSGALAEQKFLSPTLVDGINDAAHFGLEAVEVEIFGVDGRRVFQALQEGGSAIQWNCRDERGGIVESGIYIARVKLANGKTAYQALAVAK